VKVFERSTNCFIKINIVHLLIWLFELV